MSEKSGGKVAKSKTKKWVVESFVVGDVAVELREVPFRRYDWGHNHDDEGNVILHPKEQKLFEARIDDVLVGRAAKPHGFGRQAYILERVGFDPHEHYVDGLGYVEFHRAGAREEDKLYTLEAVASRLVEERRKVTGTRGLRVSSLPTEEELRAYKAEVEIAKVAQEEESRISAERFRRENNERIAREEQERVDTVGGLQEILDAFGPQLSNYQRDALVRAINRSSTPSGEYTQTVIRKQEQDWRDRMRAQKDV